MTPVTRRAFAFVLAGASTAAGGDEVVWAAYLAWFDGRVAGDLAGLDRYRKHLAAQGLPAAEVEPAWR